MARRLVIVCCVVCFVAFTVACFAFMWATMPWFELPRAQGTTLEKRFVVTENDPGTIDRAFRTFLDEMKEQTLVQHTRLVAPINGTIEWRFDTPFASTNYSVVFSATGGTISSSDFADYWFTKTDRFRCLFHHPNSPDEIEIDVIATGQRQ